MTHVWGAGSKAKMQGLHPDLQRVLNRYISTSKVDTTIMEGLRSDEQCYINFGKGRTPTQCVAAGCPAHYARPKDPKVTWLAHPLSSNHRKSKDGTGHAVDLYPYPVALWWNKKPSFYEPLFDQIAKDMFAATKVENVKIRWGANWDLDNMPRERGETDNPHFELL